jgi:hypothetical protein
MEIEEQLPDPQLMESMRSVGYSLESALADLIDNCLSAEANCVDVFYRSAADEPVIAILDNGHGMDAEEARVALKLAGTNKSQRRSANDLGRFGLGLKTASLSQGRVLTVVTKQGEEVTALEWDLDFVAAQGSWSMKVLNAEDQASIPLISEVMALETGTLVLWSKLDLLLGDASNISSYLADRMADAARHLELVFHRYIAGEGASKPVRMAINGRPLKNVDPFLERNPSTQRSPVEFIGGGSNRVVVQAFTLPHLSKLTAADKEIARIGDRMRDSQGFYVYRNRRLIDFGSWFRLTPKDELAKLARVRVDIPNSLDNEWSLDIKKSRAVPPESVRRELRRLIERIVGQSKSVHTYRGRRDESQTDGVFVWQLIRSRDSFSYRINRDHPLLAPRPGQPDSERDYLDKMFALIEDMFPVHDVYARMSGDKRPDNLDFSDDFLVGAAREMWLLMGGPAITNFPGFLNSISAIEPFAQKINAYELLKLRETEITNG